MGVGTAGVGWSSGKGHKEILNWERADEQYPCRDDLGLSGAGVGRYIGDNSAGGQWKGDIRGGRWTVNAGGHVSMSAPRSR